ncbi:MAG: SHOCT domain-containing protein [Brevibacterium sp.]
MHMEHGPGLWPFFVLIPIFWVVVIGLVVTLIITLNRRRWRNAGGPPWADSRNQGVRSAEATLAERFAQGDIEEADYRARLEVLRANRPDLGNG